MLSCDATGIPPPKVVWMRHHQVIPSYGNPSVRIRDQGRQLLLTNAQLLDEGEYTCLVTNPAGNASVDFSVSVQGNINYLLHTSDFLNIRNSYVREKHFTNFDL